MFGVPTRYELCITRVDPDTEFDEWLAFTTDAGKSIPEALASAEKYIEARINEGFACQSIPLSVYTWTLSRVPEEGEEIHLLLTVETSKHSARWN